MTAALIHLGVFRTDSGDAARSRCFGSTNGRCADVTSGRALACDRGSGRYGRWGTSRRCCRGGNWRDGSRHSRSSSSGRASRSSLAKQRGDFRICQRGKIRALAARLLGRDGRPAPLPSRGHHCGDLGAYSCSRSWCSGSRRCCRRRSRRRGRRWRAGRRSRCVFTPLPRHRLTRLECGNVLFRQLWQPGTLAVRLFRGDGGTAQRLSRRRTQTAHNSRCRI